MIVGKEALTALFAGLKAIFAEAVQSTEQTEIQRIMADVPSETAAENYPVAALLGDLEEVIDEVTITNIGTWVQNVPNRTFARIVQIKQNDIADDNIGIYRPAVTSLGRRAALYPLRLAAEVLAAGFATPWVDNQMVFSATHQWVGGVGWSNLAGPVALGADPLDAAITALETRNGPDGNPMGLKARLLLVGPANRAAAENLVNMQYNVLGASNRQYRLVDLVVLTRLGTQWFVVDDSPVKPMVLQNREGPEFTPKEDPTSDDAFYSEVYAYKGRRRCAVAILAPWLIQANAGA